MRLLLSTLALLLVVPPTAQAQTETPASFSNGFGDLASALGEAIGSPLSPEFPNPDNGDTLQITSTGLNYWSASHWPTWTNGWRHTALGPNGLVEWDGEDVDPPKPALSTAGFTPVDIAFTSPRDYLYARYPQLAARIACIIQGIPGRMPGESNWNPNARNPFPWGRFAEHASGLLQFLPSTMRSLGHPEAWVWDPFRSIDAAVEMFARGRQREFAGVAWGYC